VGPGAGHVLYEIQQGEVALTLNATREIDLRNSMETQLLETTGIDPGIYGELRSEAERVAYTNAVQQKFDALINAQDPDAPELRDGSLMSIQALRIIQAIRKH